MGSHRKQTIDRRVQKTLGLLHEALGSLIREKPYEEIVVQEILDRANVGRSTFYMHFRDKDELLANAIHEMLGAIPGPSEAPSSSKSYERILSFSLPVFQHIHHHRHAAAAMVGTSGRVAVHEHLQKIVAERISEDVKTHLYRRRKAAIRIPVDLLVQYVAATFTLVLNWWAESRNVLRPAEADALFRALVLPTLASALE